MLRGFRPSVDATDETGFRLRGQEVTRIETFTDAAFAFAVTMLVLSVDEIPATFTELVDLLRGIPAFVASLACLMLFWVGHVRFSRRYGLEDGATVALSTALIAVMLVYVYPLRFMFTQAFGAFVPFLRTDSFIGSIGGWGELSQAFVIYGIGYLAAHAVFIGLHLHAARRAEFLGLDDLERFDTRASVWLHVWCMSAGVLSLVLTVVFWGNAGTLAAGPVYGLLGAIVPIYASSSNRKRRPIAERVLAARDSVQ